MHEHCSSHIPNLSIDFLGLSPDLNIILIALIAGIIGSLSHCIGMCGPIAINQMNMRIMKLRNEELSEKARIKAILAMPYYAGKTLTYTFLLILAYAFATPVKMMPCHNTIASIAFLLLGLLFFYNAFTRHHTRLLNIFSRLTTSFIHKYLHSNAVKYFGPNGIIAGMILGLLPCGFLYSVIASIMLISPNIIVSIIAIIAFGIGTIPALILVSYFGGYIFSRFKKIYSVLYFLIMNLNGILLFKYAFNIMGLL